MSIRAYLKYRKLEREFNEGNEFRGDYTCPELYIKDIKEDKRNAMKRVVRSSLITLVTLVTLAGSGLYLYNSNEEYNNILSEAARKADLDGNGEVSGPREMAEFFNNIPDPSNYFIRL